MISCHNRLALKTRLRGRDKVFVGWTSIGHPQVTEVLVRSGVDIMGIDIEHSTITLEQSQRIIAASQAAGVACLARIASHNEEAIKRLLDSGADGIIVPMVSTIDEVAALVEWCKSPPVGRRSFGVSRAQGYGLDFDSYTSRWNETSILIIQIESASAVENIEAIVDTKLLDGVMIGPYDLSGSLGVPGQLDHPKVIEAANKVIAACKRAGIACGTHIVSPNAENIKAVFDEGFTFTALSSDVFLLGEWALGTQGLIRHARLND